MKLSLETTTEFINLVYGNSKAAICVFIVLQFKMFRGNMPFGVSGADSVNTPEIIT